MRQNNCIEMRRRLPIAFILCLLAATAAVGGLHGAPQEEAHMVGGAMGMYKAVPLSGCDDYHCLKCQSRDYCSMGGRCGMPDCGHKHAVVECHGCSIFYLRSPGGFPSCMARAREVASAVNSALALENPEEWYYVVREGPHGPEIWQEMKGMDHGNKIVSVTKADVIGYQYRANVIPMSHPAEAIDQLLVAKWWAALLQDHFDAMILGKRPALTVETHCGKPLLKAYEAARKQIAEGPIAMAIWKDVFSRELSPTDRDRLGLVAQIIPKAFAP